MLTRFPERFGAVWCTVPLLDMRRYTKLLAGPSWVAEYGDPERPEDWAFLQALSAYHNLRAGRSYPPALLVTSRRDDRVHPGHARKMAAKLEAFQQPVFFYEPDDGGHGAANKEQAAFLSALGFSFLRKILVERKRSRSEAA
jgi:prolyl oligopeptidase